MTKAALPAQKSFVAKMLFGVIAVIILCLALLTIFSVVREGNKAKTDLLEQGEMLAELLSHGSTIGVYSENKKMLSDAARDIMILKDVVGLTIYNHNLKKLYEEQKHSVIEPELPLNQQSLSDFTIQSIAIRETPETFEFISPVMLLSAPERNESLYFGPRDQEKNEKLIGYVRVILTKEGYHKEIISVVKQNIVIMLAFIVSGVLLVYFTIRTVTRPLVKLTEKVKAVGMGLPVEPVPVETIDEIGNLAGSFNEMVRARGEAEKLLRESEERYRQLVELSPDAVYVQQQGLIVFINASGVKLLGAAEKTEIVGTPACDYVHENYRPLVESRVREAEEDGFVIAPVHVRYLNRNGVTLDAELAIAPFSFNHAPAALVIARDQTERRGMEDKIRLYEKELFAAAAEMSSLESRVEERERHLIAADLHDYVGQNLAVLNFRVGRLRSTLHDADAIRNVEGMKDILEQTILYTRSLTVELNPPVLAELGFRPAIESLAEAFQQRHGIRITVEGDGQSNQVRGETRYLLFRCVRELLMNVVKHSQASESTVLITTRDSVFRVTVEDNGKGYDMNEASTRMNGFGLFSIRDRLKRLGGSFEIESRPGYGTKATIQAPLELNEAERRVEY